MYIGGPTTLDRRVRRLARERLGRAAGDALSPLFPVGLPIGFIGFAYIVAHRMRAEHRRGGPAIVRAAWLGWLAHRSAKLVFVRERPSRSNGRRRLDSFPSGHTTGTTAVALAAAYVLRREGLLSPRRALGLAIGAPAIMGAYRVLADDHWATDVFAGWLLGGAVALASLTAEAIRRPRIRRGHRGRPTSGA